MYIKELHIKSFGSLTDKTVKFERGLNVISGPNESGKSTVAMFIKFILYGLSGKAVFPDTLSEKEHYVNWENGMAAGYMVAECRGGEYIIERRIYRTSEGGRTVYRESSKITDSSSGNSVKTPKSAGEYFLGFPEKVFMQSAFVKNIDSARVEGGGLKVALENLMTSGNEEINTKKALEKLDQARKILKHKYGSGGRISELEEEKGKLLDLLKDSQDTSRKIVELEGNLSDVAVKRRAREDEAERLGSLCKAYEAVRIGAKVKSIEECEKAVGEIEAELSSLDPAIDSGMIAKIDICEAAVKETEQDIETLSEKKRELEAKCAGRDGDEPEGAEEVVSRAKKYRRGGVFCLSAGCTFGVFALLGIALVLLPSFRERASNTGNLALIITVAAAFALLAVSGFVLFGVLNSKHIKLLDLWDADDDESLEGAVMAKVDSYKYTRKLIESIAKIDTVTEEVITKHDREIDRGMAYGERLGVVGSDNVFEVLEKAREVARETISRREELTLRLEGAKGRLSAIMEDVGEEERNFAAEAERSAVEAVGREKILEMTKDEYLKIRRAKEFSDSAAAALREKEEAIKRDLAALGAAGKTPSEIAGRISVIEREIEILNGKHDALVCAYESLEKAGEKMRGDVMPRVARDAAKIMGEVTGGKYESLSSGENFDLSVFADGERRPVEFLSEGTKDASYISMRAALVKTMFAEETPVMIFDECFARIDDDRVGVLIDILSSEGMPQAVVFTCRKDDAVLAEKANIISL